MMRPRAPLYYGWVQVYALAITQLVSWGVLYYTFSVMLGPMQRETGWTSAQITGAFSIAMFVSGVASVFAGRWLDRHGPRGLMGIGSCLAVALTLAWADTHSLTGFYLVWIGIGIIHSMVLYEPAFWVVTRWFHRKRGLAMTVLTFGGGLASTVFIPLATVLNEAYGWRSALHYLAAILAIITVLPHLLLLRRDPRDLGLQPDGDLAYASEPRFHQQTEVKNVEPHLASHLRQRAFWLLAAAFALSAVVWSAMSVHFIAYATAQGLAPAYVASAASLIGIMQVVGRVALGIASDRLSRKTIALILLFCQGMALLVLLVLPASVAVFVYAMLFGIGFGVFTPIRAALIADVFGTTHYGSINGFLSFTTNIARAIAPVGVGMFVSVGNYSIVITGMIGAIALSAVTILLLKPSN